MTEPNPQPDVCNLAALRQAARHITQFYEQFMGSAGIRATQFSILAKLRRMGPMTINALAAEMVMDRTTLGRNVQPLQRMKLIAVKRGREDRRSKEVQLTDAGVARLRLAVERWAEAQKTFETAYGGERAAELRSMLRDVIAIDAGAPEQPSANV
jgi:DNA-binding MarR family transcriptional regulator